MCTRHVSLRLEDDILERLDAQSRQTGQSRSQVAKQFLDEGLRMAAHPGIIFRDGPAGRRSGLVSGPDIWEIARVFRGLDLASEQSIQKTADIAGLPAGQVRIAIRYYTDYRTEIDNWIHRVDEKALQAEAAWRQTEGLIER